METQRLTMTNKSIRTVIILLMSGFRLKLTYEMDSTFHWYMTDYDVIRIISKTDIIICLPKLTQQWEAVPFWFLDKIPNSYNCGLNEWINAF